MGLMPEMRDIKTMHLQRLGAFRRLAFEGRQLSAVQAR